MVAYVAGEKGRGAEERDGEGRYGADSEEDKEGDDHVGVRDGEDAIGLFSRARDVAQLEVGFDAVVCLVFG